MAGPLIAIVGSADPSRATDIDLRHADQASTAAEQLGRELAAAGCRIVVCPSDPRFIEARVVRDYVGSGKAAEGNARKVWTLMGSATQLLEERDHAAMSPPTWDAAAAGRVVQALVGQHRRLEPEAARRRAQAAGARRPRRSSSPPRSGARS